MDFKTIEILYASSWNKQNILHHMKDKIKYQFQISFIWQLKIIFQHGFRSSRILSQSFSQGSVFVVGERKVFVNINVPTTPEKTKWCLMSDHCGLRSPPPDNVMWPGLTSIIEYNHSTSQLRQTHVSSLVTTQNIITGCSQN